MMESFPPAVFYGRMQCNTNLMQKLRSPLAIVFAVVFIDVLGIGILIPIIPLLLTDPAYPYHFPGISTAEGYVLLGWLTAIYPFMQFLATPLLGQLSDHIGRRPVLAFSLLGTAFGYVLFAAGIMLQSLPLLFLSRALDGITGGTISVAQAAIADSTAPEKRARSFGLIGLAFGLGFILGPFLGGRLADSSLVSWFTATTPFWFAALLALSNSVAVFLYFNETLKTRSHERFHFAQAATNVRLAVTDHRLRKLFSVSFLFQSGFSFFTTFFGAYMIARFAFTQGDIGDFFALIGICMIVTQGFVTARVAKHYEARQVLRVTLLGISATILCYALAPAAWMLYLVVPFQALSMGLTMANMTSMISRSAGPEAQGKILGIGASVQALAQFIPPVLAGHIAAVFAPNTPLIMGSFSVLLAWIVLLTFARPASEHVRVSA